MRRAVLPLAAVALLAAGCAGRPAEVASCRRLPEAVLPRTAGSLSEAEHGTYCLPLGGQVSVFLTARQGRWSAVTSSDARVATPLGSSTLTAPIGVTPALFRAAAAGTVQLSSQDGGGQSWRVTLVVN